MKVFGETARLNTAIVIVALALGVTCCNTWNSLYTAAEVSAAASDDWGYLIIDAGHGGFDPGAVALDGTEEKHINLAIAKHLEAIASAHGIKTVMIRHDDVSLEELSDETGSDKTKDIHYRASVADNYPDAVYISIHQNAFSDSSQYGAQVFYGSVCGESADLANSIQKSIVALIQRDNSRETKPSGGNIYILDHVDCPMVLVECGFLTNPEELSNLKNSEFQIKMANAIFQGYINYVNSR